MASAADSTPLFKSKKNQDAAQLRRSRNFRKIERDLADKNKRLNNVLDDKEEKGEKEASRRNDDLYIDKDRAIAVGAGTDLKGDLAKHRRDGHTAARVSELPVQDVHIVLEQAEYELRLGDPEKALSFVQKGTSFHPDNTPCLIMESRCLLLCNKYREALEATNTLIKRHDCASDPEVRMVKADALYYQGSFEHALVNYFKALGHNRSKDRGALVQKIKRARMAVMNCVGSASDKSLFEPLYEWPTIKQQWLAEVQEDKKEALSVFEAAEERQRQRVLENRAAAFVTAGRGSGSKDKTTATTTRGVGVGVGGARKKRASAVGEGKRGRRKMSVTRLRTVKLLSEITDDYFYLEDLIEKLGMNQATESKALKDAREQAQEAVGFLQDRTEFWMQHAPRPKTDVLK